MVRSCEKVSSDSDEVIICALGPLRIQILHDLRRPSSVFLTIGNSAAYLPYLSCVMQGAKLDPHGSKVDQYYSASFTL